METVPDISQPYIPGCWLKKKPVHPVNVIRLWRSLAADHADPLVRLRLEWILHLFETHSVSTTATHFGISRKALRKWRDRFQVIGVAGLTDRSRRPTIRRSWTLGWQEKERIIDLKQEFPAWGREKIRIEYEKRFERPITQWQIQRVIKEKNLQWIRPKRRPKPGGTGFRPRIVTLDQKSLTPFELIHADSVELRFTGGIRRYIFTNLDHVSRIGFGLVTTTKHARHAHILFSRTRKRYPKVVYLHSDNGSDHQGELDTCLPQGITHFVSRPRTPTDNARLERFHRTLQDECFPSLTTAPSVSDMQQQLDSWLTVYNTVRPHQALGNLTPFEYLESLAPPSGGTHVAI